MSEAINPLYPILIVDDEKSALESLSIALEFSGYSNVITCSSPLKAREILQNQTIEVVLLDMIMPELMGEDLLEELMLTQPDVPVIMVTALSDLETAVRCMRKGAFDYVAKPVDTDRLAASLNKALERRSINRQLHILKHYTLTPSMSRPDAFSDFLTRDKNILQILRYCEAVAQSSQPVLVTGETGTGKEIIARGIHHASERRGEFVAVNAAGLDDHVFSDTLFGHRKGAFTGADQTRLGLVEKAAGGTLFLDEIGDLAESSQVKLLRLLQEGEFYPLGSDIPVQSAARVIVATHHNLPQEIERGAFRQDLYFRLKTHAVALPPLRERKEDITLLLEHFLATAAEEMGKEPPTYPQELPVLLHTYHFPGNVRELRSMIYDAVSTHSSHVLSLQSFKKAIHRSNSSTPPTQVSRERLFEHLDSLPTLREVAETLVDEALERAQGNQRIAASMLGITPSALNKRLKQRDSA